MYYGAGVLMAYKSKNGYQVLLGERVFNPFAGFWSIPGGKANRHENSKTTAFRELREELSFFTKGSKKRLKAKKLGRSQYKIPFIFSFMTYIVELNMKPRIKIKFPKEFRRMEWFNVDSLPANLHFGVWESVQDLKELTR